MMAEEGLSVPDKKVTAPAAPVVHRGPMEGVVIVNGRPQVERADMPTIIFHPRTVQPDKEDRA